MNGKYRESPSSEYRALAFWSLNGELSEDELFRQLLEFKMGGFGGVFLHARGNPKTPYMTNMWMEKMHFCMKTAEELGLEAWIYDELNWPSGRAEGTVERLGGKNSAKILSLVPADELPLAGELGRTADGKFAFCVGFGLGSDQLNAKTTEDFIEIIYERYKKDCGEFFGKTCPGAFFDEPQYASAYDNNDYVPWSDDLPATYKELWGDDLTGELGSLFFDEGDYAKVRKQFWAALAELYARSWGLPLYRWCEKNNLKITGHYEWEEEFKFQIRCTSDIMRHYEYEHIPGTDHLGYGLYAPWIHLQCSSVSQQLGKERTMCECFGVGGQGVTVQDRRWMYGQLLSLGVDMFVPHISHYSLAGDNKRDCPPYNQYQQPWWHYGAAVEEGISKATRITANGRDKVNVCILDPIVSAWSNYRPGDTEYIEKLQKKYESLYYTLADAGVSFHYVGEYYIKKYSSVENGKLKVGNMVYDTVILPGVTEVMDFTKTALENFGAQGGKLFAIDCTFNGAEAITAEELAGLLGKDKGFDIDKACWVKTFELDGALCRFMTNTDRFAPVSVTVTGDSNMRFIDTFTGEEKVLAKGDTYEIPAAGFVIAEETGDPRDLAVRADFASSLEVAGDWGVEPKLHLRDEKNCATLDICTLWVDTLGEITTGFTCDVRAIGRSKRLERTSAGWKAAHPEADYKSADNMRYRLTYRFRSEVAVPDLTVAAELGEYAVVMLNGKVLTKKKGYFLDRDFVCFDASEAVVCGENQLVIGAVCGRTAPVIEDVYLLGDFSCRIEDTDVRVLTETVTAISDTSFPEKQGYPFFTGELCLKNSFELPYGARNAELELCGVDASAVAVIINGTAAEPLVGAPWKRDISDLVTRGINTIELRCVGTLRNLLGPTHNTTAEKRSVGPGDYNDKSRWSDEPIFRSTGFGKAKINYNAF